MTKPKLGLITTGMGPRDEYVNYHINLLKRLDVDVEILVRHALEGLSMSEVEALAPKPGEPVIGCHIRVPGARGDRMGDDWAHCFTSDHAIAKIYQQKIDELEAEGVEATILCCAEEYAIDAFRSKRFVVQPWLVMTEWVRINTLTMDRPRIGILAVDDEHVQQNWKTWRSQPWMERLEITLEVRKGRLKEALASFKANNCDMVIHWGYGFGTGKTDPDDTVAAIERDIGVPFIVPLRETALAARNLLKPSLSDRRFIGLPPA